MASIDLVLSRGQLAGPPYDLVLGDDGADTVPDSVFSVLGALPPLGVVGTTRIVTRVSGTLVTAPPALLGALTYDSNTARPVAHDTPIPWEKAAALRPQLAAMAWQDGKQTPATFDISHEEARPLQTAASVDYTDGQRLRVAADARFQGAQGLPTRTTSVPHQEGLRDRRPWVIAAYQAAVGIGRWELVSRHQDCLRDRRVMLDDRWQSAVELGLFAQSTFQKGVPAFTGLATRYQRAWPPRPGRTVTPVTPGVDPCYLPPPAMGIEFVFDAAASASTELLFICERHGDNPNPVETIIVPARRVYVTHNSVLLRRVDSGAVLHAHAFSMTLDSDSWTWSFSATIDRSDLAHVQPATRGVPVEIEAVINGVAYRMLVVSRGRDAQFAQTRVRIAGKGLAAGLGDPYAPSLVFSNSVARTAQQLMGDVLTDNGVPLGWTIDWGLIDWLVPAGAWSFQGTYIEAINTIAAAAGGYVQPHATARVLRVLPRYSAAPWAWPGMTPDIELPADVAEVVGLDWVDRPAYNRVFVRGTNAGIEGQVTRAGTAGDLIAPMVTDALITQEAAARQRGLSVLADTGTQLHYEIKLPVLSETGLILPGKMVRFIDAEGPAVGIVRKIDVQHSFPVLRQTIGVEARAA